MMKCSIFNDDEWLYKHDGHVVCASTLGIHRVPYAYLFEHIEANSEHGEYRQRIREENVYINIRAIDCVKFCNREWQLE